jgi:hypothetical protein
MLKYISLIAVFISSAVVAVSINNIIVGNTLFGYTMLILNSISVFLWLAIFVREIYK